MIRRLGGAAIAVVVAGLVVTLLVAGIAVLGQVRAAEDQARSSVTTVAANLASTAGHAGLLAARLANADRANRDAELRNLGADVDIEGAALTDGTRVTQVLVAGPLLQAGALLPPGVEDFLASARDGGPLVIGPYPDRGRVLLIGLAARFDGGEEPTDLAERRARHTGYLAVTVPLRLGTELAARITGPGGRTIEVPGEGSSNVIGSQRVEVGGGRIWEIALGRPDGGSLQLPLLILGLGLAVTAVLAVAAGDLSRSAASARADVALRSRQLNLIEEAGARLQQSLDLAELLPAFAVALTENIGLEALVMHLADADGALVEAFRIGTLVPSEPQPATTASSVPAGGRVDVPLRRGWRTVGHVAGRAGRTLDASELTALHALTELLAVAVTNSELLTRERSATTRLRDLDTLKNAFLGTVSHELRTAMTAITGFSELLSDHWDAFPEDRRRDLAGRIRRNSGSLRALVDDLLDFARLEQQRLAVNPQLLDLGEQASQVVDRLSQLTADHEVVLRSDGGVLAWVDPFAVERILSNLLSNAVKYSPAGSQVTIEVERRNDRVALIVSDQGPGIPPADRQRVFARFYRRDDPVTVSTKGAGIGLSILGDFVTASDGTVLIEEAAGGGARFVIELPASAPAAPVTGYDRTATAATEVGG